MTPELEARAQAVGVEGDLALYATRLSLVDAWLAQLSAALQPLSDRDRAFRALGGDALTFNVRIDLGSSHARISIDRTYWTTPPCLCVSLAVVDGTVPPPEAAPTIAMQLDTPERLGAAFDAVAEAVSWIDAQLDGEP